MHSNIQLLFKSKFISISNTLGNSMKAHFKRSMKEYEAKYLREKNKETQKNAKIASEHLDANKNMPKLHHYQEDTRMNVASTVVSSSVTNCMKDAKTLTKRSLHKRTLTMHSSEDMNSAKTYFPSNSSKDQVLKQEEDDVDMEDNNNDLVIDEGDSVADEKETQRPLNMIESEQNNSKGSADKDTDYDDDVNDAAMERDIVVDDDLDGEEEHFVSSKRRRIPSDSGSTFSTSQFMKAHKRDDSQLDIIMNRRPEYFAFDEECSENEEENINTTADRIEDGEECDNSIEEELNIKCNWCQRPGPCSIKMQVSEDTNEERKDKNGDRILSDSQSCQNFGQKKAFCNERCFSLYRRAAFKKNRRCEWCRRPSKQPLSVKDDKHRYFCR